MTPLLNHALLGHVAHVAHSNNQHVDLKLKRCYFRVNLCPGGLEKQLAPKRSLTFGGGQQYKFTLAICVLAGKITRRIKKTTIALVHRRQGVGIILQIGRAS